VVSKSKIASQSKKKRFSKLNFYLISVPIIFFLIKLIIMSNTQQGGWLGADGESYLRGADAILQDGLFAKDSVLVYWPAGYSILIWAMTKISMLHILLVISVIQSSFYAYACYYFIDQIKNTKLNPHAFTIALVLAINPTLSLSSLVVGYESPIASCMLMILGLIIKSKQSEINHRFWLRVLAVGLFFALASFIQPRWILTTIMTAVIWAMLYKNRKNQALILIGVIGIMAIAPITLVERNKRAGNGSVISTNLQAALKIGTGPDTSGGYAHTGESVTCIGSETQESICYLKWYIQNPIKTAELAFFKTVYFWSPWSGPSANGTMARNPWLDVNPIQNIAKQNQEGNDLVNGSFGKFVSWIWLWAGLLLLFIGSVHIWKVGGEYRYYSLLFLMPVLASWLSAVGTIGDHRFRIPTMSLSLVLQVIGFYNIKDRLLKYAK